MSEGWLRRQRRRWFGGYTVDDPRPIAAEAPYTFYLPSENELLAVAPGDQIKLVIRSVPPGGRWDAERMWVDVTRAAGDTLHGTLANTPSDLPQLRQGAAIRCRRSDVIAVTWSPGRVVPPPSSPPQRWYWERCFVDDGVLQGRGPVDYLYREEPDMAQEGDEFADSGWRLRGTDALIAADAAAERTPAYVALGAVLNRDDSWLPLIDAPVGSTFARDERTGAFVPCVRAGEPDGPEGEDR